MAIGEFTRTMSAENPLGKIIFHIRQRLFEPLGYPKFLRYSGFDDVNEHKAHEDIYKKLGRVHIARVINERKIVIETVVIDYPLEDSGKYHSIIFDFNRKDGKIIGTIKDVEKQKQRLRGNFIKHPPAVEITEDNISLVKKHVNRAVEIYKAVAERYMESRKNQVADEGLEPPTFAM